jgi:hypothetical protein
MATPIPVLHCAMCTKPASGIRYAPTKASWQRWNQTPVAMRPVPLCSMRCLTLFESLANHWKSHPMLSSDRLHSIEARAREQCLGPLGDVVAHIGMDKALANYQREEVLALITAVVTAYQSALLEIGEQVLDQERAYFAAQGKTHPLDEVPF